MNDTTLTRRAWIGSLGQTLVAGLALSVILPRQATASIALRLTVYKDPSCGCCTKWVDHLRSAGLDVDVRDRTDMAALKDSLGVPVALRSCHTAVAGKYVIEGHVPATDLKHLLSAAPRGVLGIAVPDMPTGAPGMEAGGRRDPYDVIAFAADGTTTIFARY